MAQSIAWTYHTPTSELRLEHTGGEFLLMGEFDGRSHKLGTGLDLRVLILSISGSLDTSDPFMRGIKTLREQGEMHGWDLDRMIQER